MKDTLILILEIAAILCALILVPIGCVAAVFSYLSPMTFWEKLATIIVAGLAAVGSFGLILSILVAIISRES